MAVTAKTCAAEFLGTYMLVLTVGCNVLGQNGTWAVFSIAATLMVMIYSLGSVSGANFNPAVSFALYLNKTLDMSTMLAYMFSQVIGGILAGVTYLFLFGSAFDLAPKAIPEPLPGYQQGKSFHWSCVAAIEIAYTFMLCFVVLRAAVSSANPQSNEYFGMAIAFTVIAGGFGGGNISGGCFNPAVAIGIDVSSAGQGMEWCLAYTLFELIGAALAVFMHSLVEDDKIVSAEMGRKFISEFLGTYFLVFTVGLNVLFGTSAAGLSIAASLMSMIYALGGVSGAHFNPAVTTTLVLAGKESAGAIPVYFAAQLTGGLCAALSYTAILGDAVNLGPANGSPWHSVSLAEIIYTFVLCFVVLNVATLSGKETFANGGKLSQMYGWAIGFCIVVGGFAIGGVSGGSLNPAVSFALDTSYAIHGGKTWMNCIAYSCFEIIGASIAAGLFHVVRPMDKDGLLPLKKSKKDSYGAI